MAPNKPQSLNPALGEQQDVAGDCVGVGVLKRKGTSTLMMKPENFGPEILNRDPQILHQVSNKTSQEIALEWGFSDPKSAEMMLKKRLKYQKLAVRAP